jgi:hypothetical protein
MTYVRLFTVVLCCLIVVSGQVVHAQEGAPPADAEAPPITCEGGYAPVFTARQIFACGVAAVVFLSARPTRALETCTPVSTPLTTVGRRRGGIVVPVPRRLPMQLQRLLLMICTLLIAFISLSFAQTPALLPFQVDLQEASFPEAPALHSFAFAQADGKWLLIGGRTNGIHSFDPLPINNFSPSTANHWVWVVDPVMGKAWLVDLYDASISPPLGIIADSLSSNNTQSFQNGNTLYIIGGYGYNRTTNPMQTFPKSSRHT